MSVSLEEAAIFIYSQNIYNLFFNKDFLEKNPKLIDLITRKTKLSPQKR